MTYSPRFILGRWSVLDASDNVICTCQYEATAVALADLLNEDAGRREIHDLVEGHKRITKARFAEKST